MDTCVRVNEDADILLVDLAASEVTMGVIEDLAKGQIMRAVYADCLRMPRHCGVKKSASSCKGNIGPIDFG